ncbi:flippase [Chitinophaga sp. Mgbs1]|uniref:Flippase n=1 Tax=Chitinophaga solisilvae TaxID=1233460 RepID=A0A3S1DSV6_9BACT|nr:flippase [Chitinophaga solisilvae]
MHKLYENSAWLLADKVSKLFPGILVLALLARHLGPEQFGIWNYAIALTTIVGSMALLGMDKIAVKELVKNIDRRAAVITSIIFMRFTAALICMLISIAIVGATRQHQAVYIVCTVFSSFTVLLQSFDVFDYYYQVQNDVRKVIIPKISVFLLFSVFKLIAIALNATLVAFLWITLLELVVTYAVILLLYSRYYERLSWNDIDMPLVKGLLAQSWPLMFSNLVVVLFVKVDQVLLDVLGNPYQLGVYVVAARISELGYAIPTVIATAMLPDLIRQKKISEASYLRTLEKWLRLSFWVSFLVAWAVMFTAHLIIPFLYGSRYLAASPILMIHIWAGIPVFLCSVLVQHLIIEGAYKNYMYANIAGLIVNVGVNFLLIPVYGGVGAAIATVASYMSVYSMMLLLDTTGCNWQLSKKMFRLQPAIADFRQACAGFRVFISKLLSVNEKNPLPNE